MHFQIRSRGGDIHTDPNFGRLHQQMLAHDVFVTDTDLLADLVKLYSVVAELLLPMDAAQLKDVPEFFVQDMCELVRPARAQKELAAAARQRPASFVLASARKSWSCTTDANMRRQSAGGSMRACRRQRPTPTTDAND